MSTATSTHRAKHYSSPLRITTEAVELRDRVYPMSEITSASVRPILTTHMGLWERALHWLPLGSTYLPVRYAMDTRPWDLPNAFWPWLALLGLTGLAVAVPAGLLWLYRSYSDRLKFVYAAQLETSFGTTYIAAGEDKDVISRIVDVINIALMRGDHITHFEDTRQPTYDEHGHNVLYYRDNSFYIDDQRINVGGKNYPLTDLRIAFHTKLDTWNKPLDPMFKIRAAIGGGIVAAGEPVLNQYANSSWKEWVSWGVAALIGIFVLYLLFAWLTNDKSRDKKPNPGTLNEIHVCKMRVMGVDYDAVISVDEGYVNRVVEAINEVALSRNPFARPKTVKQR